MGDIEAAARRWAYRQPHHHKLKDPERARRHFLLTAKRWLKFLGRLQTPPVTAYQSFIEAFAAYMEGEKGLSPMTIRPECGHVRRFLSRHCTDGRQLAKISIREIDQAIALKGSRIIAPAPVFNFMPIHFARFSGMRKRRVGVDRVWRQRSWRRVFISRSGFPQDRLGGGAATSDGHYGRRSGGHP